MNSRIKDVTSREMDGIIIQQGKQGIKDEEEEKMGSLSSLSENSSGNSIGSSSVSEFMEDAASSSSLASSCNGPLFVMSSLKEQLPFKKGLSKYYQGKSQSFTSFTDISCFEDLAKPERPLKKLRLSKSCGDESDIKKLSPPPVKCGINKKVITNKASKGSFPSSITAKKSCFLGTLPT